MSIGGNGDGRLADPPDQWHGPFRRPGSGLGVQRISLNFAAFREALELGQRIGAGPVLRAWRQVLLFLSRWLQIEARYKFLARFRPAWEPRFLVYPGTGTIPG
jgi:lysyl-tRNA synthetase class 2